MGTKVQNKGGGGGVVFYLSCSLFSPSPDSIASSLSLLSFPVLTQGTDSPLSFQSLSHCHHLQCGEVQLETFLKQTTLLWSKRLFFKDCFTDDAVKYICFGSLKLTFFKSLLKERKKNLKQIWSGVPGCVTGTGMAPGCTLHELWLWRDF